MMEKGESKKVYPMLDEEQEGYTLLYYGFG